MAACRSVAVKYTISFPSPSSSNLVFSKNPTPIKDCTKGNIANAIIGTGVAQFHENIDFLKKQNYEGWLILENLYELQAMHHLNPDYFELIKEDVRTLKDAVK